MEGRLKIISQKLLSNTPRFQNTEVGMWKDERKVAIYDISQLIKKNEGSPAMPP